MFNSIPRSREYEAAFFREHFVPEEDKTEKERLEGQLAQLRTEHEQLKTKLREALNDRNRH